MADWQFPMVDWTLLAPCGGVILHEVFRLYQALWKIEVLAPLRRPFSYLVILVVFSAAATFLANAFAITEVVGRISFGFTFVTFLGGLTPRPTSVAEARTDDHFDHDRQKPEKKQASLRNVIGEFFWYRWG